MGITEEHEGSKLADRVVSTVELELVGLDIGVK